MDSYETEKSKRTTFPWSVATSVVPPRTLARPKRILLHVANSTEPGESAHSLSSGRVTRVFLRHFCSRARCVI